MDMSQQTLLSIYTLLVTFSCCYPALDAAQTDFQTSWSLFLRGAEVPCVFQGVMECKGSRPFQKVANRLGFFCLYHHFWG